MLMRRLAALGFLALAACSSEEVDESLDVRPVGAPVAAAPEPELEVSEGTPSAAKDVGELQAYAGQRITLHGRLDHVQGIHGVLVLKSGLRVVMPHFDLFMRGHDWFRHLGKPCRADGVLNTFTLNIDGYRGPTLAVDYFSGD